MNPEDRIRDVVDACPSSVQRIWQKMWLRPSLPSVSRAAGLSEAGTIVNSWGILLPPIGTYGTDYFRRAVIAYGGL
ncbi:MAG: hypothetical protein JRJ41_07220, partial [Deltaproteobacteria bacterium]|nr:hypothetical protein [Deltaproteobacteria bacterium]